MTASAPQVAPRISRRHAAGAESARGLLFTVLGEFVLPGGELAWTSAFIEALRRLGVEEKAARQAIMRTAADGWLSAERVGRRTQWQLTDSAKKLLTEGTERIYGFTGPATSWDHRWLLVMARTPETDRAARHHLRTRLAWAGLGSPAPGVWISTHTDRVHEVEQVLRDAHVIDDARIFVADYRAGGDVSSMLEQAWDLDAIDAAYQDFMADFARSRAADAMARTIELVHAWRRFPGIDPTLPRELLPRSWSGVKAADVFADRHARWAPAAKAEWARLNAASD